MWPWKKSLRKQLRHRVGSSTKGETKSGVMLLQGRPLRWPSCQDSQWSNFKVTWQPGTYQVIVGKLPGTAVPPLDVTRYKGAADYIWLHWPLRMLANSRPRQDGHQVRWANNSQNEDAFHILANAVSRPDDSSVNIITLLLLLILALVMFLFLGGDISHKFYENVPNIIGFFRLLPGKTRQRILPGLKKLSASSQL